jgi:hypothetical protein
MSCRGASKKVGTAMRGSAIAALVRPNSADEAAVLSALDSHELTLRRQSKAKYPPTGRPSGYLQSRARPRRIRVAGNPHGCVGRRRLMLAGAGTSLAVS